MTCFSRGLRLIRKTFKKMAGENLSAFREKSLNNGFYGPEQDQSDTKETRKEKE